jgi:hypothetical protein
MGLFCSKNQKQTANVTPANDDEKVVRIYRVKFRVSRTQQKTGDFFVKRKNRLFSGHSFSAWFFLPGLRHSDYAFLEQRRFEWQQRNGR